MSRPYAQAWGWAEPQFYRGKSYAAAQAEAVPLFGASDEVVAGVRFGFLRGAALEEACFEGNCTALLQACGLNDATPEEIRHAFEEIK